MGHGLCKALLTRVVLGNSCSSAVTADEADDACAECWVSLSGFHVVAHCRI